MATTWQEQGPRPILGGGNVKATGQPQVGAILAVAPHPKNQDIIWVAGVNGGIWKTTNATTATPTWTPLTDNAASLSISALDVDLKDTNYQTLIAGVGRFSSFAGIGGNLTGILKSTDGGTTWNPTGGTTLKDFNISDVAVYGTTVIASASATSDVASDTGLFLSTDSGATFTNIQGTKGLPTGNFRDLAKDPANPTNFYVTVYGGATGNGIYRSADSGATWTNITGAIAGIQANTNNLRVSVHSNAGTTAIYVGIVNSKQLASVWRSADNGTNWTKMDLPTTTEPGGITPGIHSGTQGDFHFSFVAHPTDPNIVYVGGDSTPDKLPNSIGADSYYGLLFRGDASKATGSQWTPITNNFAKDATAPHADSRNMIFDAGGNLIEVDDGGIYKRSSPTTDTGIWTSLNNGLGISELHSVDYDANTKTIMGGAQDNGADEGAAFRNEPWRELLGGDGGRVRVDDLKSEYSIRYASSQELGGFEYRQVDTATGVVTEKISPALTVAGTNQTLKKYDKLSFLAPLEVNKVQSDWLVIGGTQGVYESKDRGKNVTDLINKGLTAEVSAIAYGGKSGGVTNPNLLYVAAGNKIYLRSEAAGPLAQLPAYPGTNKIKDLALDPNDWKKAYALDQNTIYRTVDAGATWTNITGDLVTNKLGANSLITIEYVPGDDATGTKDGLLVGGLGGVYSISSPAAAAAPTWTKFGAGLPNLVVHELNYDAKDNVLVAGTMGRGAWTAQNVKAEFGNADTSALTPPPRGVIAGGSTSGSAGAKASIQPTAVAGTPNLYISDAEIPQNILDFKAPGDDIDDPGEPLSEAAFPPSLWVDINLDVASTVPVSVKVSTEDGSAKAGSDYTAVTQTLTFDPGVTSKRVRIPIPDDSTLDPDQFFYVNLTDAVGAPVAKAQAKVIINGEPGQNPSDIEDGSPYADYLIGGDGDDTISGYEDDDTLDGGVGNDILDGGTENDSLIGGLGDDSLFGGDGDDSLQGNEGNDTLDGGLGKDILNGGDGNDTLSGDAGDDSLVGGPGNDSLVGGLGKDTLSGDTGDDSLVGGAGDDSLVGDDGKDILNGGEGNDTLSGDAGDDSLVGGAGDDNLVGGEGNDILNGGDGKDTLSGDAGDDSLVGGAGDDNLVGGDGKDILDSGEGNDTLSGDAGDDSLVGGAGDDNLVGDDGKDILNGGDGNDTLSGDAGDDSLVGGPGNDNLVGGDGKDTLQGGEGNNTIDGGLGDDSIVGGPGNDSLDGGAGIDTLSYGTSTSPVNINLATGNIKNIEVIIGTTLADTIIGSSSDESLIGNGGADILTGGGGNDTFILDPTKSGGSKIQGAAGTDNLIITGNTLVTSLTPGSMGIGRSGTSLVVDLNKDGQINLANDIELLNFFASTSGNVPGTGFIETVAGTPGNTILAKFATPIPVIIPIPIPTPTPTPTPTPRGPRILTSPIEIPNPNTSVGSTLNGGAPNDFLLGSLQADALNGLAGDDTIYGLDGSDNIGGGDGEDSLFGNAGNDFIDAGNGNDIVYGGKGSDGILGSGGNDSLYANKGLDVVFGGDGNDVIFGGKGDDTLGGDAGDDSIFGQLGNDFLLGGSGNDVVNGGEGDDTIAGIDPSATNPGVGEFDTLTGGTGNDRFLLGDSDKVYYSGDGNAVISDFNSVEDAIVLSGVKANYSLSVAGNVTSIFLKQPGQSDDLIATVQGVTDLNLDRAYFTFI